jgi:hypothetical protein
MVRLSYFFAADDPDIRHFGGCAATVPCGLTIVCYVIIPDKVGSIGGLVRSGSPVPVPLTSTTSLLAIALSCALP